MSDTRDLGGALDRAAASSAEAGLADASVRLVHALARREAGLAVSFDASGSEPEAELLRELDAADPDQAEPTALLAHLLDQLAAAARIETRTGGRVIATTMIDLTGDTRTTIARAATAAELERHGRLVARTLRTRTMRARIVLSVFEFAAKIALATGTGDPLAALPAAWRFATAVIGEWQRSKRAA